MTTTIHGVKREPMRESDVYVGRAMRGRGTGHIPRGAEGADDYFGNPHPVQAHGRKGAVAAFERTARRRLVRDPAYRARVRALHGRRLFCWCAPQACHAEVLARLAAELSATETT